MSRLLNITIFSACALAATAARAQTFNSTPPFRPPGAAFQTERGQVLRPSGGDQAVQQIIARIRSDADALRRSLDAARPDRSRDRRMPEDEIQFAVDDVVAATDHLSDHLDRGEVVRVDIDDLMRRGGALDERIGSGVYDSRTHDAWTVLQRDLDAVASAYGQAWNWRNPVYAPVDSASDYSRRLRGTYELDTARSDDPQRIVNQALRQLSTADRSARELRSRLDPPSVIAIDRDGDRITLASSQAGRTSFDADGRPVSERGLGNHEVTTRAAVYGDRIEVSTNGAGGDDFDATFEPLDGGRSLRLTKRLHLDAVRQPVTIQSVYRRVSETPDWNVFNGRREGPVGTSGRATAVPDGTMLNASLDAPIDLRTVRSNDRVTLTVHNAPEVAFENAVLEGHVSAAPADADDRQGLAIAFDRLRLRDGRAAAFSGTVENVRGPNGEPISFNGENVDSGDDRRDQAIKRGTIGAAVGAIIGAIAGGGKGAAVGAVVGAGGGAATVMIGGQRQTELPRGTTFTVRTRGDVDWDR